MKHASDIQPSEKMRMTAGLSHVARRRWRGVGIALAAASLVALTAMARADERAIDKQVVVAAPIEMVWTPPSFRDDGSRAKGDPPNRTASTCQSGVSTLTT